MTVPAVGMGTWQTFDVRGAAAEAACRDGRRLGLSDAGATFFDSSPMYGEAERVLGLDARRPPGPGARRHQDLDQFGARRRAGRPNARSRFFGGHDRRLSGAQSGRVAAAARSHRRAQGGRTRTPGRRDALQRVGVRRASACHGERAHRRDSDSVQPARTRRRARHPAAGRRTRPRRHRDASVRRRRADQALAAARPRSSRWRRLASAPGRRRC